MRPALRYITDLQVLRGNIRVICRIRPSTNDEPSALITNADEPGSLTVVDTARQRQKSFEFNDVCTEACAQAAVFEVRHVALRPSAQRTLLHIDMSCAVGLRTRLISANIE